MNDRKEWTLRFTLRDRGGQSRDVALDYNDRTLLDNRLAVFAEFYTGSPVEPGRLHVFRSGDNVVAFVEESFISLVVERRDSRQAA